MKKMITLFCALFCTFAFVKAESLLNEQFNSASWDGYTTSGNYEITTSAGKYILTACSVEPTNNMVSNGATSVGRVTLTGNNSAIELPELSNCGIITINANSGSVSKNFSIQKKVGTGWETLTSFTTHNELTGTVVPVMDYSYNVKSEGPITLRIINTQSGAVRLYEISVETYVADGGNDNYVSKEIIHEQFNDTFNDNVSGWGVEGQTTGAFTIPVVGATGGTGTMTLTACAVAVAGNQTGASSAGRIRIESNDYAAASVELPEISSCGKFSFNGNAGTASGKTYTLQKKEGNNWTDLKLFEITDVPLTYDYDVNSATPITLRMVTKQNGAKNIYEIWVTDYVLSNQTATESVEIGKGEISSIAFYDITGRVLQSRPVSGIYIERAIYQNGAVETKKLIGIEK